MPRTRPLAVAVVLACGAPAVAHANSHYSAPTPETPEDLAADATVVQADKQLGWEGGVGFQVGTFHTGPVYNLAYGFALEGGARLDRLKLLGNYTFMGLGNPTPGSGDSDAASTDVSGVGGAATGTEKTPTGFVQRVGATARYSIARGITAQNGMGVRGDFWVEAGLGEQFIRWTDGGYLDRHDIEFGFGAQMDVRGERHHGGWYMGMRVTLAPPPPNAPALTAPPSCAGPCDGPTRPLGIDRSILFVMAVDFGS